MEDMDMEDMLVDTPLLDMVLDTPPDMVLDTPPLDMVLDTRPTDMDSDMDVVSMVDTDTLASVPLILNPKLMLLLTCTEDMEDMDMEDMLVDTPPSDMVLDTLPDMVLDTPPTDMDMDVVSMDGDVKCFASQCSSKSFHPETANSTYKSNLIRTSQPLIRNQCLTFVESRI